MLRQEIARLYHSIKADDVLTFAGAEEGIYCIMRILIEPGDHVIVIDPCYQSLATLPETFGGEVTAIPLKFENEWKLDLEEVKKAFRPSTKLLVLNYPHNPTGTVLDRKVLDELIQLSRKTGVYIFCDEVYRYMEVNEAERMPSIADVYEKGISLNVMTKSFGLAGLRIGWLASRDAHFLKEVGSYKLYTSICNSAPSEILAIMALRAKDRILERNRQIILENLNILDAFMKRNQKFLSWNRPQSGTMAVLKLILLIPIEVFAEDLVRTEGVLIMPGSVLTYLEISFVLASEKRIWQAFWKDLNPICIVRDKIQHANLTRDQIEKTLSIPKVLKAIEQGFILYSQGEAVIPPIGSLHFDQPPGDCHIKYGYSKKGKYYVVKIASGFYENPKHGLPSNNGLMLLFDKQTGKPVCILLDEGYLIDIRTAAVGCVAAKYLAPKIVTCVGIVGTGAQAYYQLKFLSSATQCRKAMIWGRDIEKAKKLAKHPDLSAWAIEATKELEQLVSECNLIVTTTASSHPLLFAEHVKPGTHITAVGADDIDKQELDEKIFIKADKIIVDSRSQCAGFGDVSNALKKGLIELEKLVELGEVLMNPSLGRTSDNQITVCDLTGIAIQDLQIAESVFSRHC